MSYDWSAAYNVARGYTVDGQNKYTTSMPFVLTLWKRQADRGREPGDLAKVSIGCAIFAASALWLAPPPLLSNAEGRTPLLWGVGFHLISNLGWLYFTPIGLEQFPRSPTREGFPVGANRDS